LFTAENAEFAEKFDRFRLGVLCDLCDSNRALLQRGGFLIAAFEFEHHAFDVLVLLMRAKNLQTLLRIAPMQNLDRFLARAPRVHVVLVRHVEVDRVSAAQRPTIIFHAIRLPGR
jgi:hypothetical protein